MCCQSLSRVGACAAAKRTNFTARNLANLLWGLAKVERHPGEQMLGDLAEEIGRKIDGANAQNLVCHHALTLLKFLCLLPVPSPALWLRFVCAAKREPSSIHIPVGPFKLELMRRSCTGKHRVGICHIGALAGR